MTTTRLRPRPTPAIEHARGMLTALRATHTCGTACTSTVTLGDGKVIQLRCPYAGLDLDAPADRRLIAGIYAAECRALRQP